MIIGVGWNEKIMENLSVSAVCFDNRKNHVAIVDTDEPHIAGMQYRGKERSFDKNPDKQRFRIDFHNIHVRIMEIYLVLCNKEKGETLSQVCDQYVRLCLPGYKQYDAYTEIASYSVDGILPS